MLLQPSSRFLVVRAETRYWRRIYIRVLRFFPKERYNRAYSKPEPDLSGLIVFFGGVSVLRSFLEGPPSQGVLQAKAATVATAGPFPEDVATTLSKERSTPEHTQSQRGASGFFWWGVGFEILYWRAPRPSHQTALNSGWLTQSLQPEFSLV